MLERFIYSRADHILVVTKGARDNLLEKGVNPDKISVMPHWIDETKAARIDDETRQSIRQTCGWNYKFVILFAGNIGVVQGLETAVQAAALLPRDSGFLISLIGIGADRQRLQELANSLDVNDRIQFLDRRPAEEMPFIMEASDALLVHLKRSPIADWVIPTKVFAYLSAGKPILMAMGGAAAEMVKDSGAGIIIRAEDAAALSQGIHSLRDLSSESRALMGRQGQEYLATNFSKLMVLAQYEKMLQVIANRPLEQ
jgi:glycosyltransferase involved in cell wall biosynthesis